MLFFGGHPKQARNILKYYFKTLYVTMTSALKYLAE